MEITTENLVANNTIDERTIDNSQYSYRVILEIHVNTDYTNPANVKTMVYGIRLKYQY